MKWLKQHKKWLLVGLILVAALALAYWYGGDAAGSRGWKQAAIEQPTPDSATEALPQQAPAVATEAQAQAVPDANDGDIAADVATEQPPAQNDQLAQEQPAQAEQESVTTESNCGTCTVSISCATILNNMQLCDPAKQELVPADGVILAATAVSFSQGESAFDLLLRVCRDNGVHLEYADMPLYDSAYIEGIANLYEFDVGELSGWVYRVNNSFPNYGCSGYQVQDGDVIDWLYSCDLGHDLGGGD